MNRTILAIAALLLLTLVGWSVLPANPSASASASLNPEAGLQEPAPLAPKASLLEVANAQAQRTIHSEAKSQAKGMQLVEAAPTNLHPDPTIRVQVLDTNGRGIFGAVAHEKGSRKALSFPTDSMGWTSITDASPLLQSVHFIALGYLPGSTEWNGQEELRVILQRTCKVTVHLQTIGSNQPGLRLDYTAPMFGDTYAGPQRIYGLVDGCYAGNNSGWGRGSGSISLPSHNADNQSIDGSNDQLYVITGMNTDVPFELNVVDSFSQVLLKHSEPGMQAEEWRDVRIIAPVAMRPLTGRVLDPGGHPLEVRIGLKYGDTTHFVGTDALGRFEFSGVGSDSVSIRIGHSEFASFYKEVAVPPSGHVGDLTMEWPCELNVFVRDEQGTPLRSHVQALIDADDEVNAETQSEGHYRFSTLGPDAIEISIIIGGRIYTRRVTPEKTSNLEVVLPVHGSIEILVPEITNLESMNNLRVVAFVENSDSHDPSKSIEELPKSVVIGPLLPGRVRIRLERWSITPPHKYEWIELTETASAQIRAGETSSVKLTPKL
ncbi:MAG: carboxypeptidase regulatory-like domain-containing protein [Planctomycetes bacterium]|nr:carboxypeptidase regulatory-like domain-containing protein [Planctomycetota bacterium]